MTDPIILQTDITGIATIIVAIGTMFLACITAYYAKQTRKTVDVMEKSAELSIMPHIKGHLITEGSFETYFRISNVGLGPANNILVKFWLDTYPSDIKTWENNVLMPNDHEDFILIESGKKNVITIDYFEKNPIKIHVQAKYENMLGEKYSIDEIIDASKFVNDWIKSEQRINHEPLQEIADSIRRIEGIMDIEQIRKDDERRFSHSQQHNNKKNETEN